MKFRRFGIFYFIVLMLPVISTAQNLVPNGGFEEYIVCPGGYTQHPLEFRVPSWRSINSGSPDYFNSCSTGEAAVPYNWAGVSDAFEGNGYAGIYTWMNLSKDYREYLHCKLSEPLVKDSVYRIEFRYKLSSYSKFSIDRIGVLISDSLKPYRNDKPIRIEPTFSFVKDSALTLETGAWEVAAASYRATGNEQFLTIGNFSDNSSTRYYHIKFRPESQPMLAHSSYYYIDDVKVIPAFSEPLPNQDPLPFTGDDPVLNTLYVLKNIEFEFNSYALLPVSYIELDKIVAHLQQNPGILVRLAGHTDDIGYPEYNDVLSLKRAESAAAYLISKGIKATRIATTGYGESKPLVFGTTKEARGINRRVEIEFYR
jgi:OOP family OmpA-OmpF porin